LLAARLTPGRIAFVGEDVVRDFHEKRAGVASSQERSSMRLMPADDRLFRVTKD